MNYNTGLFNNYKKTMKQFIKLMMLMLIGLALNGCYNAQEKEAIEKCRRNCKYPLTFEVINTSSTSYPPKAYLIDLEGVCYIRHSESITDSFKIFYHRDNWYVHDIFKYWPCRIDSIRTLTIKQGYPSFTQFTVTYSCKNDFGVPCQDSRSFIIINDCLVSDFYVRYFDDFFIRITTTHVNHFINNSPDKLFKSIYEVEKYLNNFESNFKLKN